MFSCVWHVGINKSQSNTIIADKIPKLTLTPSYQKHNDKKSPTRGRGRGRGDHATLVQIHYGLRTTQSHVQRPESRVQTSGRMEVPPERESAPSPKTKTLDRRYTQEHSNPPSHSRPGHRVVTMPALSRMTTLGGLTVACSGQRTAGSPVAHQWFTPAPVAHQWFTPAPVAHQWFTPAPVAHQWFTPAPVVPPVAHQLLQRAPADIDPNRVERIDLPGVSGRICRAAEGQQRPAAPPPLSPAEASAEAAPVMRRHVGRSPTLGGDAPAEACH